MIGAVRTCLECGATIRKIQRASASLTGWADRWDGRDIFGSGLLCPRRPGGHIPDTAWMCVCGHDPHLHIEPPEAFADGCLVRGCTCVRNALEAGAAAGGVWPAARSRHS